MLAIKRMLWSALAAILLAVPSSSSAITINEVLARQADPVNYDRDLGWARAGLLLSLSTRDGWQTAQFDVTFRSHLGGAYKYNDVFFGLSSTASNNGILASDFHGTGYIDYFDTNTNYSDLFMSGLQNGRVGFTLSSSNPNYSVWDALSSGFGFDHFFFGNEYNNQSWITLSYPGITSYKIQLGDAAAVPLPPSLFLGLAGLLPLALIRRKRKKSAASPAKTTRVPAEAFA